MKIIDATNLIAGRIATRVAKLALLGEEIIIVNSEKAILTGSKKNVFEKYNRIFSIGVPKKGPFLHRTPDKILRRIIRGMLPYKKPNGSEAFSRIKCYNDVPEIYADSQKETFEEANASKLPSLKKIDILTLSKLLGAKI
jgi:large subunit ribosomal protein L13